MRIIDTLKNLCCSTVPCVPDSNPQPQCQKQIARDCVWHRHFTEKKIHSWSWRAMLLAHNHEKKPKNCRKWPKWCQNKSSRDWDWFFKKRVRFGGWWPLVASKTVYYYHFLLQKFRGCWDSGTFMIYQALFSFLLTFSRVFSTMSNRLRWVVEFSIFAHKVSLSLSSKWMFKNEFFVYRISSKSFLPWIVSAVY